MKWVSNRIQTHSHTSEPASANTPSSRRNNIQNINLSDSNWRMNTNVRMCRHELFECWQLFHPHIPPPSNIPASTRSHIRSQGSREHQSDLEFATSLHRRVQKNWAPRSLFLPDVPSGELRCGGRLRRCRMGALGGWVRLWGWEASEGGGVALWRGVSSLPLLGSAGEERTSENRNTQAVIVSKCWNEVTVHRKAITRLREADR